MGFCNLQRRFYSWVIWNPVCGLKKSKKFYRLQELQNVLDRTFSKETTLSHGKGLRKHKKLLFSQHFDSVNQYKRNRCNLYKFVTCKFSYIYVNNIWLLTLWPEIIFPRCSYTKQNFTLPTKYTLSNVIYEKRSLLKIIPLIQQLFV